MTLRRLSLLYIGLLSAIIPLAAQDAGEQGAPSIIRKSPFLPPDFQPPGGAGAEAVPPAQAGQFEFRGVYQMDGVYYFNLYDKRQQKGSWVSKEKSGGDVPRILEYDIEQDILVVDDGGMRMSLGMIETSDRQLPLATSRPATVSRPGQPATAPAQAPPTRRRVIRPASRTTEQNTSGNIRRRVITPSQSNTNP